MSRVKIVKAQATYESVEMREPLVSDLVEVERMTQSRGFEFAVALVSRIATFDGKRLAMEDVARLPVSLFFELSQGLLELGLDQFGDTLSPSAASPDGDSATF